MPGRRGGAGAEGAGRAEARWGPRAGNSHRAARAGSGPGGGASGPVRIPPPGRGPRARRRCVGIHSLSGLRWPGKVGSPQCRAWWTT